MAPNQPLTFKAMLALGVLWIVSFLLFWEAWRAPTVPGFVEVMYALGDQLTSHKFYKNLLASLWLAVRAIGIATAISLAISYAYAIPLFRPLISIMTTFRFLSVAGLTFLARLTFASGDSIKLSLLVFGICVFFITNMAAVVRDISEERYEYGRTLGMSEWQIMWEFVVLETAPQALETIRQNNAIGWVMLFFVEVISRTGGGIGTMLYDIKKWGGPDDLFAVQLVILAVGFFFDQILGLIKVIACPHLYTKQEQ